ncbi:glycosyltransferase [Streptomyces albus subsp. chlorinus]|uniref:glycosyltransferase n=1 Tax=Streptomyces albus TaxID=1888 RepID=UPI0015D47E0C
MKIVFLLDNAYGIGGTIRSTVNLSGALAERHEVEVVSLRRSRQEPALTFDPRVRLRSLIDLRPASASYDGDDPDYRRRSERFTEGHDHFERGISTRLGDLRMKALLENLEADVVIGTRPKINDYLAAYGTDAYLRIGQEHLTHRMHSDHIRTHQDAAIARLDAFVTVSYADAADYRAALPDVPAEILCVPNAVPAPDVEPSDGRARLIVAAGRLIKVKRYDRLLRAFALVADKHPDWSLRLYGRGPRRDALRALIDELGLCDRAFLMGAHSPIETEWAKGSIAAVSSDAESFGMTLVEAMHCGVPVVSTDCPYGPGEIIANGRDGLLAPLGEDEDVTVHAYADALLHLVEDPALRTRMGQAALEKAARYSPGRIAGEYEELMARLLEARKRPGQGRPDQGGRRGQGRPDNGSPRSGQAARAARGPRPDEAPGRPGPVRPPAATASAPSQRARPVPAPSLRTRLLRIARRLTPSVFVPLLRPLVRRRKRGDGARGLRRPVARVRAARDGGLLVRLRADTLPKGAAVLSLRPRHREDTEAVRVPLPPRDEAAADGWVEARLHRASTRLPEARWDVHVERVADGRSKRVRAELVETARLLSMPAPLTEQGVLEPWVPYTTADGFLALRTWSRDRHAEVTAIERGGHGYLLTAHLYGQAARPALSPRTVELSGGPVLAAVPRGNPRHAFEFPGRRGDEPDTVTLELPYELPAAFADGADEGVWDLWLRPGLGPEKVRLARLLGDLPDRKKTDVTPPTPLGDSGRAVQLYFSLNNNLVLTLKPLRDLAAAAAREPASDEEAAARTTAGRTAGAAEEGRAAGAAEEERAAGAAEGRAARAEEARTAGTAEDGTSAAARRTSGAGAGRTSGAGAGRNASAAGGDQGRSSSPSASASA